MQVGTEAEPYEGQATIMLHGHVRSRELPIYGTKVLGVRQGALELHGRETATPWTRLGATVQPGGTTIDLEDAVDWQVCKKPNLEYFITKIWHIFNVWHIFWKCLDFFWQAGDEIVIATTGDRFSQGQNEQREIAEVQNGGSRLVLTVNVQPPSPLLPRTRPPS